MAFHRLFRFIPGLVIALAIGLGPVIATPAQTRSAPLDLPAIETYLQTQMEANHIPGLAVAVVKGNEVLLLRGYGEARPGQPMTPETQFFIGSLTKSFTALAILRLVDQGKLELDAPVQRYLPWFRVADDQASGKITLRHLLNQTSGLSEDGDPDASRFFPTLTEEVRALKNARLTAPVGSRFQYFNQNYRVLGLVMEQVTGQAYADALGEQVLAPLGLTQSTARPEEATNLAVGHGQVFGLALPRHEVFRPSALPSGYLVSNAEDMARYMRAMLANTQANGQEILPTTAFSQLFSPPAGTGSPYGMGWMAGNDPTAGSFYYHDGNLENYHAEVLLLPEAKVGVAVLVNQGGMVPQLTSFPTLLQNGVGEYLIGRQPQPRSFDWLFWTMGLVAVADLTFGMVRLGRIRPWSRKTLVQRKWVQWLKALTDLGIGLGLLMGAPVLVGAVFGGQGGWAEMFSVLPDVAGWLLFSFLLGIVRGSLKVGLVLRRQLSTNRV